MKESRITYGVSLSVKACRQFNVTEKEVLDFALRHLGVRRFRLMTYWDECEPISKVYDFSMVQRLIEEIARYNGEVTLCLGLRQPRWPECHPPEWVTKLEKSERNKRLYDFVEKAVEQFRNIDTVTSYQLENEALNRGIGTCTNFSRIRLLKEYELIKQLDPDRPIIMSTSDSWGIPWRKPRPDVFGFSLYRHQWTQRGLSHRHRSSMFLRYRKRVIEGILHRSVICHELQMEPWGPRGTEQLSDKQQLELMSATHMEQALEYARACDFTTIDLWGLEWWYWRSKSFGDTSQAEVVRRVLAK